MNHIDIIEYQRIPTSNLYAIHNHFILGLFLLSKNWGSGGWVKKTPPTDTTPAYFNTTTTSVTDKEGALVLRIILISREYDGDGSVHDGGDYGTTSSNTMHNERNQA